MDKVLNDLNVDCIQLARANIILSSGTEAGLGLLMLVSSAPATYHDVMTMLDSDSRSTAAALQLGKDGSRTLGGLGFTARGTIGLASVMSEAAANSRWLMGVSRWAGAPPVGLASRGLMVLWCFNTRMARLRNASLCHLPPRSVVGWLVVLAAVGLAGGLAVASAELLAVLSLARPVRQPVLRLGPGLVRPAVPLAVDTSALPLRQTASIIVIN